MVLVVKSSPNGEKSQGVGAENTLASKLTVLSENEKKKLVEESKESFYRRRRIQISQLPPGTTTEELTKTLLKDFKVLNIVLNDQNTAHVLFSNQNEAKEALSFIQGKAFKGKIVSCSYSQRDFLLFVGNIPYNYKLQRFREITKQYGEMERILLVHSTLTGQSKGYGFVEYTNKAAVEKAKTEFPKNNKAMTIDNSNSGLFEYYDLQSQTLSVSNFPPETKGEQIEELITKHVQVPFCKIPTNATSGQLHALVDCKSPEDAELLWKELDGAAINGGSMRIRFNSPGQLASTNIGGQSFKATAAKVASPRTPSSTTAGVQIKPQRPDMQSRPFAPASPINSDNLKPRLAGSGTPPPRLAGSRPPPPRLAGSRPPPLRLAGSRPPPPRLDGNRPPVRMAGGRPPPGLNGNSPPQSLLELDFPNHGAGLRRPRHPLRPMGPRGPNDFRGPMMPGRFQGPDDIRFRPPLRGPRDEAPFMRPPGQRPPFRPRGPDMHFQRPPFRGRHPFFPEDQLFNENEQDFSASNERPDRPFREEPLNAAKEERGKNPLFKDKPPSRPDRPPHGFIENQVPVPGRASLDGMQGKGMDNNNAPPSRRFDGETRREHRNFDGPPRESFHERKFDHGGQFPMQGDFDRERKFGQQGDFDGRRNFDDRGDFKRREDFDHHTEHRDNFDQPRRDKNQGEFDHRRDFGKRESEGERRNEAGHTQFEEPDRNERFGRAKEQADHTPGHAAQMPVREFERDPPFRQDMPRDHHSESREPWMQREPPSREPPPPYQRRDMQDQRPPPFNEEPMPNQPMMNEPFQNRGDQPPPGRWNDQPRLPQFPGNNLQRHDFNDGEKRDQIENLDRRQEDRPGGFRPPFDGPPQMQGNLRVEPPFQAQVNRPPPRDDRFLHQEPPPNKFPELRPPQGLLQAPPLGNQQQPPQLFDTLPPQQIQHTPAPGSMPNPKYQPSEMPQQMPPSMPQQMPPAMRQMPPAMPQQMPSSMPQQMPPAVRQQMPPAMQQQMSSSMPQQMPPSMPQQMPPSMPQQMPSSIPQQMPPSMPQQVPSSMPQQMPPSMPQQMPPAIPQHLQQTQLYPYSTLQQHSQSLGSSQASVQMPHQYTNEMPPAVPKSSSMQQTPVQQAPSQVSANQWMQQPPPMASKQPASFIGHSASSAVTVAPSYPNATPAMPSFRMPNAPAATGMSAVSGMQQSMPGSLPGGSSSLPLSLPGAATAMPGVPTGQQNSSMDTYIAAASAAQQYAQYYQQLAKQQEFLAQQPAASGSKDASGLAAQATAYAHYYQQYYQHMQQILQVTKLPPIAAAHQTAGSPAPAQPGQIAQNAAIPQQPPQMPSLLQTPHQQPLVAPQSATNPAPGVMATGSLPQPWPFQQQSGPPPPWQAQGSTGAAPGMPHSSLGGPSAMPSSFTPDKSQPMNHGQQAPKSQQPSAQNWPMHAPPSQAAGLAAVNPLQAPRQRPLMQPLMSQLQQPPPQAHNLQPQGLFPAQQSLLSQKDQGTLQLGSGAPPPMSFQNQQSTVGMNWMYSSTATTNTVQPQHFSRPVLYTSQAACEQHGDKRQNEALRPYGPSKRPRF